MLNIDEINNTIIELENGVTTFDTCIKLAALYTVKERIDGSNTIIAADNKVIENTDEVVEEYHDILPQYHKYIDIKREYQLGKVAEQAVETQIKKVCDEISEFIHALYTGTDMPVEREHIKDMLGGLQNL